MSDVLNVVVSLVAYILFFGLCVIPAVGLGIWHGARGLRSLVSRHRAPEFTPEELDTAADAIVERYKTRHGEE